MDKDLNFEIFKKNLFEKIDKILDDKLENNKNIDKKNEIKNTNTNTNTNINNKNKSLSNSHKKFDYKYKTKTNIKTKKKLSNIDDISYIKNNKIFQLLIDNINSKPVIKKEDEIRLLKKIKLENSEESKEEFIERNLRFVYYYLRKYYNDFEEDFLDIFQEASIGLIYALDKFDIKYENRFVTYASWWMRNKIQRYIDKINNIIHIPVHLRKNYNKTKKLFRNKNNKRTIYSREYIRILNKQKCTINDLYRFYILNYFEFYSLYSNFDRFPSDLQGDLKYFVYNDEYINIELKDVLPEDSLENDLLIQLEEEHEKIDKNFYFLFDTLKDKEKEVLFLRLGLNEKGKYTLEEIGFRFGLTRERIRQIESAALQKVIKKFKRLGFRYNEEKIKDVLYKVYIYRNYY